MCGRWCDETPVNRARPVVLAQSSAAMASSISAAVCWMLCSSSVIRQRSTWSSPACFIPWSRVCISFLRGRHSGKRLSCEYQEKPKWILSRRPLSTFA